MGVVYKAWHHDLGRLIALKMILAGGHAGLGERTRFRAEAESAASLRHPNIVHVHEIGEVGGLMYFAMEYIEGKTLREVLQGTPLAPRAAAKLLETLARAVEHAHRHGIVHRDLKPANVLLEVDEAAQGDAARPDPVPKVVDFGLAKRLGESLGTQTGQLVGTPGYMPPEQLAGQKGATGPAVDTYALGCILYETLTGRPPFLDTSVEALVARVRREDPVPPRRLQPKCPRDLETVCLKCLEKDPARRYDRAGGLADDLARFLAGEPIRARAPTVLDRLDKFAQRNRPAVVGIAAVIAALALGIATTTVMAIRETRARRHAEGSALRAIESARQSEAARNAALCATYQARLAAAMGAIAQNDIRQAVRQLDAAPEALRGWEWNCLRSRLDQSVAVVAVPPRVGAIAFCPPGRRLAVTEERGYRICDAVDGATLAVRDIYSPCLHVFVFETRLGTRFLLDQSTERDNSFAITDGDGKILGRYSGQLFEEAGVSSAIAMSPDGRRFAFQTRPYSEAPLIDVFDTATGNRVATCGEPWKHRLLGLDFNPDCTRIAAARSDDTDVLIFDAVSGRRVMALEGHARFVRAVAYSPDGRRLASCADDQTVRVWDAETGRLLHTFHGHEGAVLCVAFSGDGRRLVSGGSDGTVRIWSAGGGEAVAVLRGHTAAVSRVALGDDDRVIASTAWDGTARLWDATSQDDLSVLRGHLSYVYPVACSPDGRLIASGSWDHTIRLWDAAGGTLVHTLTGHTLPVGALAFSPDGLCLASRGEEKVIRFWDIATGKEIGSHIDCASMAKRDSVYGLVFSPDGKRLGAAADGGIRFWDPVTRAGLAPLGLPVRGARVLAFSPDGRRLAAGGDAAKVVIVDANTGALVAELNGFEGRIQSVAFSPNGLLVLTAGMDPTLRLWSADTGRLVRTFAGHGLEVLAAVFHPDGTRIASGGHDRSILIWDVATGAELVRLPGHSSYVFSLAFSPNGQTLVSGSGDSTIRLWDAFPVVRRLQARRAGRLSVSPVTTPAD
jgi:WD40 repeat protein